MQPLKKWTVVLLYPLSRTDGEIQPYVAHVVGHDATDAIARSIDAICMANDYDNDMMIEEREEFMSAFEVIAMFHGHHDDVGFLYED